MNILQRLKDLEAKIFAADGHEGRKYYHQMQEELYLAWPEILAVINEGKGLRNFVEKHLKENAYRTASDDEHAHALMEQWDEALAALEEI